MTPVITLTRAAHPETNRVIDEAMDACLAAHHSVTIAAKQVRLELLKGEG